ncbi:sodium:solute symporter family transporter [Arenicella xantha]|uniref:SSS family solute:Na+ symporter/sodium/pantothenate symporter n=1 Tax=Arenicella xantha TaxID=644221 RepID=A0A395JMB1_9GAMM|nr:sodium:solute symporter family protein [Arenicella xantha]RBP51749.1 SSS family solute:Na+ symporter/sodium/pantothenate symporter [Arenicella xantha]
MTPEIFKYSLTIGYALFVLWLSWVGMRRTRDLKGFAIGNKDMSPYVIGFTLAASIASTATFVINPGFVYADGLSAFLHYGVSASLGICAAFVVLTRGFLRLGETHQALTIPEWIYHRYQSRELRLFFALINLLSITFVVLILVGCALLMTGLFPIDHKQALVVILLFVFAYVLMGGTYAHAYTNTLQGGMMLLIAIFLFADGFGFVDGGFIHSLQNVSENYAAVYNPESRLYFDFVSVFLSGFVVTFALMLQPHILTKVLYLRSERDIKKFIGTTVIVGFCFSLMLAIGFYARFAGLEIDNQDAVVREYLLFRFGDSAVGQYILTFIFLTLLAAGMSTLDGILVSLSAMVINDIATPLFGGIKNALLWSRILLVVVGVVALLLAWNPPALIGLFAQKGVYGLAAASAAPLLFGVLYQGQLPKSMIFLAAISGLVLHLILNLFLGVANPAVSATIAIGVSVALVSGSLIITRIKITSGS